MRMRTDLSDAIVFRYPRGRGSEPPDALGGIWIKKSCCNGRIRSASAQTGPGDTRISPFS